MKFITNLLQAIGGLSMAAVFFVTTWWAAQQRKIGKQRQINTTTKNIDKRQESVERATKDIEDLSHEKIREKAKKRGWFRNE